VVIGSTEDTHIMAAYFSGLKDRDGLIPGAWPCQYTSRRHVGLPLILTVLTTTLGFASNLFNDIALIQHFAIAASFAMVVNGSHHDPVGSADVARHGSARRTAPEGPG
jgi:uncharacterized protein